MAQLQKKFIADNAVDENKIRLSNNANLRARNFAGSGDISIIHVNASDRIEFPSVPQQTSDGSASNDLIRYSQAILRSGANAFTADQSMGSHKLTNVLDPTSAQDAATKNYVDSLVQGLSWKNYARLATAAALPSNTYANGSSGVGATLTATANGALSVDGSAVAANDRILVKNESTGANNGIYVVTQTGDAGTPYILTRATDADDASEVIAAAAFVDEGTANADTAWVQTTIAPVTMGTTSLSFVKFSSTSAAFTFNNGLTLTGSQVDVAPGDTSLTATPGSLVVNLNAAGAIVTSSGLKINLEATNPSLQISSNRLGVKFDPAGALASGSAGVAVQVDNSTIEINSDALRVKDAGITLAKLASNSVDENKIVSTTFNSSGALNGGSGTKVAVRVDAATVKINGSNNLEGLKELEEQFTLSSTDITNQYVDLSHAIYGASASANSAGVYVVGGVMQQKTVDYTVSLTGGSGGVTRISFAGDLATGGNAALVSGDILVVKYQYLT